MTEFDSLTDSYSFLVFRPQKLAELGLASADFPVPSNAFERGISIYSKMTVEMLLYWMLRYISHKRELYEECQEYLLDVAERFAEPLPPGPFPVWGNDGAYDWEILLDNVDLQRETVTYEGQGQIKAAFGRVGEGAAFSCYSVPSLNLLLGARMYSRALVDADHGYTGYLAFQVAANSMGYIYSAIDPAEDRYVEWAYGVGWHQPEHFNDDYKDQLGANPLPASWVRFYFNVMGIAERQLSELGSF